MTQMRGWLGLIGLCLVSGGVPGCGEADPSGVGALKPAAAEIIVDGSSTVYRISLAAQKAFNKVNPAITVVVDNHGTGGGFGRYLQGEVDIVDASRAAKAEEESKAKEQGIEWSRFVVGNDGITLVVNPKNDFVKSLSVEQLKAIWQPGSKAKTWKDVDASWPDRKIILYSPDNDSGTFEFFSEAIVGKAKSQRDDVQPSSDDNTLVNGVAGDRDALGYFGYAYYGANTDKLRAVAVQNGPDAQPVLPSKSTIADKSYKPLSRPLFIYVKNSAARRPEVAEFLKFYLDNVGELSQTGGYDPPTAADTAANQEVLAKLLPSTTGGADNATEAAKK
ncbi:MAG TPA: PstS family phosphate ABC transporter substrate-binding protein [Isosphaeraceae bacterium]|nr:PstS family phosphate ABC transporter substrate-binding protein [Isosphaeraceae bacterium]